MSEFICTKTKVREILDYHELKCSEPEAYTKVSEFLDSLPDTFPYNDFCGKLNDFMSPKLDRYSSLAGHQATFSYALTRGDSFILAVGDR